MPSLTYPGVYMQEVSSGVKPIEAAGTSTAAFFGVAERGPIGEVKKIFNFTEFQTIYGGFLSTSFLAHGVFQFFNNGGTQCYVGRTAADNAAAADVTIRDRDQTPQDSLTIAASSAGLWGNRLQVTIEDGSEDPDNQFNLTLFRDVPDSDPEELEAFENLSMDPGSPSFVETVVNGGSNNLRIAIDVANSHQIAGFSESDDITLGGDLLGANQRQFRVNVHGDGVRTVDLTTALQAADLSDLTVIRQAIEDTIQDLTPNHVSNTQAYQVSVTVENTTRLRITSGSAGAGSKIEVMNAEDPLANAAGALRLGRRNGGTEVFGSAPTRPQNTAADAFYLLGDNPVAGAVSDVTLGSDGTLPLQDQDFIGALNWLDTVRDVSLIAIPGVGSGAVADAGMNYCRNVRPLSDCFFIADMDRDDRDFDDAIAYRDGINNPDSYGAVYYPWIRMLDPTGASAEPIEAPPSGFVAGLYSQIDGRRGVWKAPAGTEATVGGAVGLVTELTDIQHGNLNKSPISVCVIRKFPSAGIVLWGSRTMSSDPEYKYIPVRRMAIFLRVSIFNGIQWAVFEPNDEDLWAALRLNIGAFMMTLFRQGAFQGASPSDAFFVKVDGETTTQADIDNGTVNILIGFAPLKPAEFVVVKISQKAGQSS